MARTTRVAPLTNTCMHLSTVRGRPVLCDQRVHPGTAHYDSTAQISWS